MSRHKGKLALFLERNPKCIYCGGETPSEDRDHQPPKGLFLEYKWPDGYMFASCRACNNGSSDDDYLVSVLMSMCNEYLGRTPSKEEMFANFEKLKKRRPDIYTNLTLTTNQKRRYARSIGYVPPHGSTYADMPLMNIGYTFGDAVDRFGKKLLKALHYKHTNLILPTKTAITVRWVTNANWIKGENLITDEARSLLHAVQGLKRDNIDLTPQFHYSFLHTLDLENSLFHCKFGQAFSVALLASVDNKYQN